MALSQRYTAIRLLRVRLVSKSAVLLSLSFAVCLGMYGMTFVVAMVN